MKSIDESPATIKGSVLSVSELTQIIKQELETKFSLVLIEGEISNFKRQSSGHLYFSLKDAGAQIGAVMFRGSAGKLRTLPKDGDSVMISGELSVYAPRGNYQVIVRDLHFVGVGELLVRLEELKREIAKRGWFDAAHKKPLPRFPKRIGVVTSPTGAAVQDMLNVLRRRAKGFSFLLDPVRVQGKEAAGEIAAAIRRFNENDSADVLIIGRGGGSIEDLWAFNEEIVARAIFESRIPIIAAIGHETDHTIADYVADVRAPTPSAAAEIVMAEQRQQIEFLQASRLRAQQTLRQLLSIARHRLKRYASHPLLASPYALLGRTMQQCDDLRTGIDRAMRLHLERTKQRFESRCTQLDLVDPRNVLKKGYAILSRKSGPVIKSARQLPGGTQVVARLSDGAVNMRVEDDI